MKERYQFDALNYYRTDIDWFAFSFIMILLSVYIFCEVRKLHNGKKTVLTKNDQSIDYSKYGDFELYVLVFHVLFRIFVLF